MLQLKHGAIDLVTSV